MNQINLPHADEAKGGIKVTIRPDPYHPDTHWRCEVESRGRVWFLTWADPKPTIEQVRQVWEQERHEFIPLKS